MALSSRRISVFGSVGTGTGEAAISGDGVCVTVFREGEMLELVSGDAAVTVAVGETIATVDVGLGVIVVTRLDVFV
jgi:hypothetical protein